MALEKEIGIDAELIDSCAFGDPRTCKIGFDESLWETSGAADQSGEVSLGLILVAERCEKTTRHALAQFHGK